MTVNQAARNAWLIGSTDGSDSGFVPSRLEMRYVLVVILALHAVAHLVGFAVPWRLVTHPEMPYRTTILQGRVDLGDLGIRLYGLGWLALGVAWATTSVGVALRSSWWLLSLEVLVACSLFFCVLGWPEARLGVFANSLTLLAAFAAIQFTGSGIAIRDRQMDELWRSVPTIERPTFDVGPLSGHPILARQYIEHVIAPGTPLAAAVRLKMHGEIKLGRWYPFHAEQVITQNGEFVWAATVSMFGLPIRGSDRLLNGEAAMKWKLLDAFPVMTASGSDITRSAFGRLHAEQALWLPSTLLGETVSLCILNSGLLRLRLESPIRSTDLNIELHSQGSPKTVKFSRWGDPDGEKYREVDFGVIFEQERHFGGFTIPNRIRAGWFFGTPRFESEGEFFRATIDDAEYK